MNRRRTKKGASDSTEMVDTIGFNTAGYPQKQQIFEVYGKVYGCGDK